VLVQNIMSVILKLTIYRCFTGIDKIPDPGWGIVTVSNRGEVFGGKTDLFSSKIAMWE
jgi:hypothetical protein